MYEDYDFHYDENDEEAEHEDNRGFIIENKVTGEILELDCKMASKHFLFRHKKCDETILTKAAFKEKMKQKINTTICI